MSFVILSIKSQRDRSGGKHDTILSILVEVGGSQCTECVPPLAPVNPSPNT